MELTAQNVANYSYDECKKLETENKRLLMNIIIIDTLSTNMRGRDGLAINMITQELLQSSDASEE
jgi:hypothetical protein